MITKKDTIKKLNVIVDGLALILDFDGYHTFLMISTHINFTEFEVYSILNKSTILKYDAFSFQDS